MSDFYTAIPTVLKHEGGFVNDPDDPGGATKYGVSLRYLVKIGDLDSDGILEGDFDRDGDVDIDDIRAMSLEDAEHIYKIQWWDKNKYERINSQEVATKVFDLAINMGSKQGNKCLQRAIRACGYNCIDDGIIGNRTLSLANKIPQKILLPAVKESAAGFYRMLIALKPVRKKYENGWLTRAYS